ncbi:hypothetical protein ACXAUS_003934 [Clostridium sporogenes]|uniref:hypothetical protein n=1 Tax=Clostridium sporogenes TaxID=1509 RepID=UPI00290375C0|nr:hypothetical protein [Clostridium botulinum]
MVVITGKSIEQIAKNRQLYKLLREEISNENEWESVWVYCKKIASSTHAPVTLKEYQRMEKFIDDDVLVSSVASIMKRWVVPNENVILSDFDVIGYFYSIALLSEAQYNREENICLLSKICDTLIEEKNQYCKILLRNMTKLKKKYPDLIALEEKLKVI